MAQQVWGINTPTVIGSHFVLVARKKENKFVSENPVKDLQTNLQWGIHTMLSRSFRVIT